MDDAVVGLIAAAVGGAAGFVTAAVKNVFDKRSVIDESVRHSREARYADLWTETVLLPKWPKASVTPEELHGLSERLRDWYFGASAAEAGQNAGAPLGDDRPISLTPGGLYLSTSARKTYGSFQDALANAIDRGSSAPDKPIEDADYDTLQKKASALRTELTRDLLSRRRAFLTW